VLNQLSSPPPADLAGLSNKFKQCVSNRFRKHGKISFIQQLPVGATVLDIGCGNDSPIKTKMLRPDIRYIGLDVQGHDIDAANKSYADSYIMVDADSFHLGICSVGTVDAVISSHNIEHCNNPIKVLSAVAEVLRPGGCLYLSTPCAESAKFPHRKGTLNFYDDVTHHTPVSIELIRASLEPSIELFWVCHRYRPFPFALLGLVFEPISAVTGRVMKGTWDLYGFETVIWGRKN